MPHYLTTGQDFYFSYSLPELKPFERTNGRTEDAFPFVLNSFQQGELISRTNGWIGGVQRRVEVYDTSNGMLLNVENCGEFFITVNGEAIIKQNSQKGLTKLDREIILGPALVLTLALRDVWCLHASAVMHKDNVIVFLGESGQGKSTLAAYLSQNNEWRLVADDILPVAADSNSVSVLPRFPQLKLPMDAQPGVHLPERLPLKIICVLEHTEPDQKPELHKLSTAQTVQSLLSHIAGTRMFTPSLLTQHLEFSTQASKQISAFRLKYPHKRDSLPLIREFLEEIC
jgi:hypothetical protein